MVRRLKESVYTDNGYNSRKDYLNSLADDFGVDVQTVYDLASILGPEEDFDALVTELEDYRDENDYDDEEEVFDFNSALDWELNNSTYSKYVVCDAEPDEYDFYLAHYDTYDKAAEDVIINLCRYSHDCVLYDKQKKLKTVYRADMLDTSRLDMGDMHGYDGYFANNPEVFADKYTVGEDAAVENIRDILDMCEESTEKY